MRGLSDPDEILLTTLEMLSRHLDIARAGYIEATPDGFVVAREWRDEIASFTGSYLSSQLDSQSVAKLQAGEPLCIENAELVPGPTGELLRSSGANAALSVPLLKKGKLCAALGLAHVRPRHWTDADIQLVRDVGERTWDTLGWARAQAELRTSQNNQAFLLELADATRNLGDPGAILAESAERLGRRLGVSRVAYVELTPDTKTLSHHHEWSEGLPELASVSLSYVDGATIQELNAGEIVRVDDVRSRWDERTLAFAETRQVRAFLTVPLMKEGRQLASLSLTHHEPRRWTDTEAELAREVAERTWETLQRARAEAELRTTQNNQAFLLQLADKTRDLVDADAILDVTVEMLGRHLGIHHVGYVEVGPDGDGFISAHEWSARESLSGSSRLSELDDNTRQSFQAGVTVRVNNVWEYWDPATAQSSTDGHVQSFVSVPLLRGGRYVASLALTHTDPREWTDADVSLAKAVAERTWETLQRARAESKLRESQANQAFLLNLSDATREETDATVILETTATLICHNLGVSRIVYVELTGMGRGFETAWQWVDGVEPVTAVEIMELDEHSLRRLAEGEILAVADVRDEKQLQGSDFLAAHQTIAFACIPLIKGRRQVATLTVTDHKPHEWTKSELDLLLEVAGRTWATLQRAGAEAELRKSEALLSAFMENAPIGMYLKDAEGRYLLANSEMEKLFGCPIDEVIGRTATELCAPEEAAQVNGWDAQLLATGSGFASEQERPGSGAYQSTLVMRFPVRESDGEPFKIGGFDIDLTEQKRIESELKKSREALYQSEKLTALGSLLAGVSHELNNPLSVVVGQALIMEEKAVDTATAARATKIRTAAERCARIVQTFLAMARQRQPERQLLNIHELIEAALDLTSYGLRAAGIRVVTNLSDEIPELVGDASQLHQLFANIIINAQHALETGSGPRELRISTEVRDSVLVVDFLDSGPGISADIRHRIFEPFFTTKPVGFGTGMGLSFAYGVAQAHGGDLELVDVPSGSCFRLTLPVSPGARRSAVKAENQVLTSGQGTVLVVEDEPDLAETLAEMLEVQGWDTVVALGGAAAISQLNNRDFDVVLSDVRMPGVDGGGLWEWVNVHRPHLVERFAFVTGDTLGSTVKDFLIRANRPFAEKPFSPQSIAQLVESVVKDQR